MRLPLAIILVFLSLASFTIVSCEADDEDALTALCRNVGATICTQACICGDCTILQSNGTSTISFENEDDCRAIYIELGCQEPDDSIDLDACSSDLEEAECADDPSGSPAFGLPASCE